MPDTLHAHPEKESDEKNCIRSYRFPVVSECNPKATVFTFPFRENDR